MSLWRLTAVRLTDHHGPGKNQTHGDNHAADTDVAPSLHGSYLTDNDDIGLHFIFKLTRGREISRKRPLEGNGSR